MKVRGPSYPIVRNVRDARALRLEEAATGIALRDLAIAEGAHVGWIEHWGLNGDPFVERGGPYVPLPGHQEAVARLVHAIEAGHGLAVLSAPAGTGKTIVLSRALAETREPRRRFALTSEPIDGAHLYSGLAQKLGFHGSPATSRGAAWMALEQAVRCCALQGIHVVLAVDESRSLITSGAEDDLRRLGQIGAATGGRVTILLVQGAEGLERSWLQQSWTLSIGLRPLTCSEAEKYLSGKLAAAGCREPIFSQRAVTRLHLYTHGSPRGLDRLASLCLMAGASRGLEAISSDVVEGVIGECDSSVASALEALATRRADWSGCVP